MYSESAALYDLIYSSFKDFRGEARQLAELIHARAPGARSVLDVACGTAAHARWLTEDHAMSVDGVDLDPAFVAIARGKLPAATFTQADLADFHLGRTYDAVVCLFGSIGYVRTLPRLASALACLREHTAPGGVVIVEPFFTPEAFRPGVTGSLTVTADGRRITRTNRSERAGELLQLHFDYVIEPLDGAGPITRAAEVHELGLFTVDQMRHAFAAAGLAARYDAEASGLSGRGLYVATVAS